MFYFFSIFVWHSFCGQNVGGKARTDTISNVDLMNLKNKLDEYLINGLDRNNILIYKIDIQKDKCSRYVFTIRFQIPIPIPFPLSRTILFDVTNEKYKRKDIVTNIYIFIANIIMSIIVSCDILCNLDEIQSEFRIIQIIAILLTPLVMTIFPYLIIRKYMSRITLGYEDKEMINDHPYRQQQ